MAKLVAREVAPNEPWRSVAAPCTHPEVVERPTASIGIAREVFNGAPAATPRKEMIMEKRELGRSGLQVSAIGFGCVGLNFGRGTMVTKEEGIDLIHGAIEHGSPSSIAPRSTGHLPTKR
jgi:hypothetical protein